MNNIKRVMSLIRTLGDAWEFIKSLWSWENKAKSTAAFIVSFTPLHAHPLLPPITLSPPLMIFLPCTLSPPYNAPPQSLVVIIN